MMMARFQWYDAGISGGVSRTVAAAAVLEDDIQISAQLRGCCSSGRLSKKCYRVTWMPAGRMQCQGCKLCSHRATRSGLQLRGRKMH